MAHGACRPSRWDAHLAPSPRALGEDPNSIAVCTAGPHVSLEYRRVQAAATCSVNRAFPISPSPTPAICCSSVGLTVGPVSECW
jgi:hypothetical protein